MMTILFLSVIIVGSAMLIMGVGVLLSNRCLRGSCGGPDVIGPDGESLLCETCPHRAGDEDRPAEMGRA